MNLLIVALFAVFLQVGAQKVTPNTTQAPVTKDGSSIGKLDSQQKTDSAEKPNSTKPPVVAGKQSSSCCFVEQPQTESKEEKAKAASFDRLYRRYLWATIIGVCFASFGVGLIVWQSILLRQSASAAKASADAALLNAQAFVSAERPWLFVTPIGFKLELSTFNRLDWRISNRGRTVANVLEVRVRCRKCRGMEKILTVPPEYKIVVNFYNTPISPGANLDAWSDIEKGEDYDPSPMGQKDIEDIQTQRSELVAYAYVLYRDQVGGKLRESRFCYYYAVPFQEFRINLRAPAEYHQCD